MAISLPRYAQHKFETPVIEYSFDVSPAYFGWTEFNSFEKAQTRQAMAEWEAITNIRFSETSYQQSHLDIGFKRSLPATTLGEVRSFNTHLGRDANLIEPSRGEFLTVAMNTTSQFYVTVLHELGHVLGFDHINDQNSLMAPFIVSPNFRSSFQPIDIATIQALYGSPPISLPPPNNAPTAQNDSVTVMLGESVLINYGSNDRDPDGDQLSSVITRDPFQGSLTIDSNQPNTVTYTPGRLNQHSSTDSFIYQISDGRGGTASATVTISIIGPPDVPGDSSTTATIGTGVGLDPIPNSVSGVHDSFDFADWFRVSLPFGRTFDIQLNSSTGETIPFPNPTLQIYSEDSQLLFSDTDSGIALNAQIIFSPTNSGTYYLSSMNTIGSSGSYELSVNAIIPTFPVTMVAPQDSGALDIGGGTANDILVGGSLRDFIHGRSGDDLITGGGGNDSISGGVGSDTVVFSGAVSDYAIEESHVFVKVTDSQDNRDGRDFVRGIENYKFSDGTFQLSELLNITDVDSGIYRFFNIDNGTHFYSASILERDSVINNLDAYNFENTAFKAADPNNIFAEPVFRFFNTETSAHFFTQSIIERDSIIENLLHFNFEGEAYKGYTEQVDGSLPLYRFYNTETVTHFYTAAEAEKDSIIENLPNFNFEGIAYWVDPVIG